MLKCLPRGNFKSCNNSHESLLQWLLETLLEWRYCRILVDSTISNTIVILSSTYTEKMWIRCEIITRSNRNAGNNLLAVIDDAYVGDWHTFTENIQVLMYKWQTHFNTLEKSVINYSQFKLRNETFNLKHPAVQ